LQDLKKAFINFAIQQNVLRFGRFELKSGRISPYFFNAGLFNTGAALAKLGTFYAQAIINSASEFDLLLGPAYKGIPIATATAIALYEQHGVDIPFAFNRKEAKNHGEGGNLVGAQVAGRVMIIDDVITAGTAIREIMDLVQQQGAVATGVMIALDRQEKGTSEYSAIQEIELKYGVNVFSVVSFSDLLDYMRGQDNPSLLEDLLRYREQYGVH